MKGDYNERLGRLQGVCKICRRAKPQRHRTDRKISAIVSDILKSADQIKFSPKTK
jgi:hypothetical protein